MTEANAFIKFMTEIWDSPITATETGGTFIAQNKWYDYYHDARKTAAMRGAFKRWSNKVADMPGITYEFPDGSRAVIASDGSAVTESHNRHKI